MSLGANAGKIISSPFLPNRTKSEACALRKKVLENRIQVGYVSGPINVNACDFGHAVNLRVYPNQFTHKRAMSSGSS